MRKCPYCNLHEHPISAASEAPQIWYVCGTTAVNEDAPYVQSYACDYIDALQRDLYKWKQTVEEIQDAYEREIERVSNHAM